MHEASPIEERVHFTSEGLRLEGILAYPDAGPCPDRAVLLLSPHPHLGGNMENNVIRHIARRAAADGLVSLRFNYRGVGRSTLSLPAGTSLYAFWEDLERERRYEILVPDVVRAFEFLQNVCNAPACTVVGYSLGAILAGMLPSCLGPCGIVAISPPTRKVPLDHFLDCPLPKLFICGDEDFAFDPDAFRAAYSRLPHPKAVALCPGADHFFRNHEERVYQLVHPFTGKYRRCRVE